MNRTLALLAAVFFGIVLLRAEGPDEQYVRIYQVIQEADRLNDAGQSRAAAAKYLEAQDGLRRFQNIYPGWNDRIVTFRLNYVATKLAPLSTSILAGSPTNTSPSTINASVVSAVPTNVSVPVIPQPNADVANQIKSLQAQVEQLQADNRVLGAKLKEALSVQPAAPDPRELAHAEERIRALLKENELLKVRAVTTTPPPSPQPQPTPAVDTAAIQELNGKLAQQIDAVAALRSENELLKTQAVELQKKNQELVAAADSSLSKDKVEQLLAARDVEIRQISEERRVLEKDRALLSQLLEQRNQQPDKIPSAAMAAPSTPAPEVEVLRARIEALEAKAVPYTREELALLTKPVMALATPNSPTANAQTPTPPPAEGPVPKPAPTKKVSRDIPPGAGSLVTAAERAFALGEFADAERKYLDVLRQDPENIRILGDLASTQVQLGRLDEAEKNVRKALAIAPDDYFSLYVLGRVKFDQSKIDEALDALSRSAKVNPDYAETQNYLGIVLSEKGQRGPAEAALRKAIQLQPNHRAAHHNLAVVYATQTPPALALARWHYQKALIAGHQKNAELEKLLEQK